jgi:hypothetical protein
MLASFCCPFGSPRTSRSISFVFFTPGTWLPRLFIGSLLVICCSPRVLRPSSDVLRRRSRVLRLRLVLSTSAALRIIRFDVRYPFRSCRCRRVILLERSSSLSALMTAVRPKPVSSTSVWMLGQQRSSPLCILAWSARWTSTAF